VVHVAVLLFIIAAGAVKAKPSNLEPFAPFGARGVFSGAAYVYFTYTGFDAVATSAEEVRPRCGGFVRWHSEHRLSPLDSE
jgi:basic amino acid/polyamine antiporter, APA family